MPTGSTPALSQKNNSVSKSNLMQIPLKTWMTFFYCSLLLAGDARYPARTRLNGEAVLTVTALERGRQRITFRGDPGWSGLPVSYRIGTCYSGDSRLAAKGEACVAEFEVSASREEISGKPFLLYINDFPLVTVHSIYEYINATNNIRNNVTTDLVQIKLSAPEVGSDQDWMLSVKISQSDGMLPLLQKLSASNLKDGTIFLMIASHQDTGWEDTPSQCEEDRDLRIISPALKLLEENPDFSFNVENMLSLMEFLKRNPHRKDDITRYTREGRLSWGAMYNQPYEEMYSGESLVRECYFGRKWFIDNFPGLDTRTVWNVDVPGRTLQAAQIMAKSGIKYLVISRQGQGLFEWQSPDGSKVKVYSPGDYGETWRQLQRNHFRAFRHIGDFALQYQKYNGAAGKNAVIPFMANKDMSPPFMYSEVIESWNNLDHWETPDGKKIVLTLPKIRYGTPEQFFAELEKLSPELPVIKGERPNVWVYIHGPSHHYMLTASREGGMLLTAAEKFAAFHALLENNWSSYPQQKLNEAWQDHLYADHGMGGKNGHITDQLFLDKSLQAKQTADSILTGSLRAISARIDFSHKKGIPLVVFNSLSWERTGPVQASLALDSLNIRNFTLTDQRGNPVAFQLINAGKSAKGDVNGVEIVFLAENVPSLGYKTYRLVPSSGSMKVATGRKGLVTSMENNFYRITLSKGGITQIRDKGLNMDLFRTEKFLAGELFTMQSEGTGASEFAQVQQPDMEGFEKISDYRPAWHQVEDGPLYQSAELIQRIRHATVKQKIILYHYTKKIDFQVSIVNWEGIQFREFRLAFPVNMPDGKVVYEVPFGKVEIGTDEMPGAPGERYQVNASDIRPRGILNWTSGSNGQAGITLSSPVAVWDYKDPTGQPAGYPMLQPVLLASRRSCHSQGNWYLQEGDHHYSFSLTSHPSDWRNGYRQALEHNEPLIAVFNPEKTQGELPPELSFMRMDQSNVTISTIKKSETEDKAIIRLYETEGAGTTVTLKSYFSVNNLIKCNLIEQKSAAVMNNPQIDIGKYAIETFELD